MTDQATTPLADRLATCKATLNAAIQAYLAGDATAWAQAIKAQAEVEALQRADTEEAGR